MSLNPKGKLIGNIGELTPGMTKKFILENMPSMEFLLDNRGISLRLSKPVAPHWYLHGLGG